MSLPMPPAFLEIILSFDSAGKPVEVPCAGFEVGQWRKARLVRHAVRWLPEFALRFSEWSGIDHANAVASVGEAAKKIYETKKYENRGELGELLLHILLRQRYDTFPAISKIHFKDGPNETVKGFDAFHVNVDADGQFVLWLGESKLYPDGKRAIRDVVKEIADHMEFKYLRSEFTFLMPKLDDAWQHTDQLKVLLNSETSLDKIFPLIRLPIFISYNSKAVKENSEHCEDYLAEVQEEVNQLSKYFENKAQSLSTNLAIHLFFLPIEDKVELVKEWDSVLANARELA